MREWTRACDGQDEKAPDRLEYVGEAKGVVSQGNDDEQDVSPNPASHRIAAGRPGQSIPWRCQRN